MESIKILNFGPIKEAEVTINDINIFIGTTSSGKSTVAKLISIFKGGSAKKGLTFSQFNGLLENYNIDFKIDDKTNILYENNGFYFEVKGQLISTNFSSEGSPSFIPIYIPAERVFLSTISQSIFGLMNSNISLPKWIIDFGAKFEQARNSIKKLPIKFLHASYEYSDGMDYIQLSNNTKIKLNQASSGLQSVIPLILMINYNTRKIDKAKYNTPHFRDQKARLLS